MAFDKRFEKICRSNFSSAEIVRRQLVELVDDPMRGVQASIIAADLAEQGRDVAVGGSALDLAVFEACRAQDALHEFGQTDHRCPDLGNGTNQLFLGAGDLPSLQPLGAAVDDGQRRAEFVGNHRYELTLQATEFTLLLQSGLKPVPIVGKGFVGSMNVGAHDVEGIDQKVQFIVVGSFPACAQVEIRRFFVEAQCPEIGG